MSTNVRANTGDIKTAIKHAMDLLGSGEPRLAREQAEEILRHYPNEVNSQFVVAAAMRARGQTAEALSCLEGLIQRAPDFALAQQELGFTYADKGHLLAAIKALQRAVAIEPKLPASWKLMGELFIVDGDETSATEAFNRYMVAVSEDADSAMEPELFQAVKLFRAGKIGRAEQLCRDFLKQNPANVNAIRLLAEIGIKVGVLDDAEKLLERCLELAPNFGLARLNFAHVLSKREKLEEALAQVDQLLAAEPENPALLTMQASILVKMGDFARVLPRYAYLLSHYPPRAGIALVYGHALKTVGQQDKAIAAYRQAISLQPSFGDAYWSLANLKTFRFDADDIETMRTEIDKSTCKRENYFHLCFALGKALEDRRQYDESFHCYRLGNNLKKKLEGYNADKTEERARRVRSICSCEFLSASAGKGDPAPDPIFIVGLPRSGSTLLEQILASHSQVDGTKELVYIPAIVRRLGGKVKKSKISRYPDILAEMNPSRLRELGQEYMDRSRIQRADAPFFIDKMPNNFMHIGLIHLILPNARIIDARRHPMAACFSSYTQLFARGQSFTYGLSNIGRYYRNYVDMMDHWDLVLPGKVLRVHYEQVVSDIETQVRRMLDHCGLEFEEACLQFHQTRRAVRTASSEQVRQPIYTAALEHWRNYETHLNELKSALGSVLERYPID